MVKKLTIRMDDSTYSAMTTKVGDRGINSYLVALVQADCGVDAVDEKPEDGEAPDEDVDVPLDLPFRYDMTGLSGAALVIACRQRFLALDSEDPLVRAAARESIEAAKSKLNRAQRRKYTTPKVTEVPTPTFRKP